MMLVAGAAQAQTVLPDAQEGVAYSQALISPPGFPTGASYVGGGTPPGLAPSAGAGGATLSGTPTLAGTYTFSVRVDYLAFGGCPMPPCPASQTNAYTLTVQPTVVAVPTLSEWAMILFGTVLAGGAALLIERRRRFG